MDKTEERIWNAPVERGMLVAFTYDELLHVMRLLGNNIGDAKDSAEWESRDCDMSRSISERLQRTFGRSL